MSRIEDGRVESELLQNTLIKSVQQPKMLQEETWTSKSPEYYSVMLAREAMDMPLAFSEIDEFYARFSNGERTSEAREKTDEGTKQIQCESNSIHLAECTSFETSDADRGGENSRLQEKLDLASTGSALTDSVRTFNDRSVRPGTTKMYCYPTF